MDQIETQKLINQIEEQARTAVHKWADAKVAQGEALCACCVEDRVQALAQYVIEGALSFAADEDQAEEFLADVMSYCDKSDREFAAEQDPQESR